MPAETYLPDDEPVMETWRRYYESEAWSETYWLGHRVARFPNDLWTYGEMVHDLRPARIVDTRAAEGGLALFLAGCLEAEKVGRVIALDGRYAEHPALMQRLPDHRRVQFLKYDPLLAETAEHVGGLLRTSPIILFIGVGDAESVTQMLDLWMPLAPYGSAAVVEGTALGGHPVCPQFSPGPHEALSAWLIEHPEWEVDVVRQRHGLTLNPGGFLQRVD